MKSTERNQRARPNRAGIFVLLIALAFVPKGMVVAQENSGPTISEIRKQFAAPQKESGVNCWWWWLNGNVDKAAITRDLEAMRSRNFQGAMVFDAGGYNSRGYHRDIPAGPLFGSPEWIDMFVHALDEARRLDLEIGLNIQSGWNLGGPIVPPEMAAKHLVFTQEVVNPGKNFPIQLAKPATRWNFYQDIAVLAIPIRGEQLKGEFITDLELKAGFDELGGSAPDCRFLLTNANPTGAEMFDEARTISKSSVLDITEHLDQYGNLNWRPTYGRWTVLRMGYTCTDARVSTSSGAWKGKVVDYLKKEAFDFYWHEVVDPILARAGDHVGTTLTFLETDSWECGGMNWTDDFREEFENYRGYDPLLYLPIIAGFVVDSVETSNRFLADFRKTLGDLVAHSHYARFQEYAHQYNMGIQPESAGPHAGPFDGIKNYGFSDIVMSEFWSPSPHRPTPERRFFVKQASSAAHIYGKKIVGAESFTTIGHHWNDELWRDQKSAFDHEICAGLNRTYFHTFVCSPEEMGLPGQVYFAGTHVNPQVTWWNQSGPFIDYLHRVQSVVQEGSFVADALYYYGDHVPNVFPNKHSDPAGALPGFDYDVTDETIFLQLKVSEGKIEVPGGVQYRVVVLPDHKVLSLAVLKKIEELLKAGATVLGPKPEHMVSLVGGEAAQEIFSSLVTAIWGQNPGPEGRRQYGQGTLVWGMNAREYLLSTGLSPDCELIGANGEPRYDFIHYTIGGADVYFVSNQTPDTQKFQASFRVTGKQPELWDAVSGKTWPAQAFAQKRGMTTLPLILDPYGTAFVVFDRKIPDDQQGTHARNHLEYETFAELRGKWTVEFDTGWGGPARIEFPELLDWSQHSNPKIKYYSGEAMYRKSFSLDEDPIPGRKVFIELGSVKDVGIAEIRLNGSDLGTVWTPPFRAEVPQGLLRKENELEIKVVNSWYNRVAGDDESPNARRFTSTNINFKVDRRGRAIDEIPLEPSGLLGPVRLKVSAPVR